ncbi:hypothetical protein, partial [Escherichia coli]
VAVSFSEPPDADLPQKNAASLCRFAAFSLVLRTVWGTCSLTPDWQVCVRIAYWLSTIHYRVC